MLLTLRVTEERKRTSSVATYSAPHIDADRAVIHQDLPIADQFHDHAARRFRAAVDGADAILACYGGF